MSEIQLKFKSIDDLIETGCVTNIVDLKSYDQDSTYMIAVSSTLSKSEFHEYSKAIIDIFEDFGLTVIVVPEDIIKGIYKLDNESEENK